LKIIYDAAHAFGVKMDGYPIVDFGDLSILSFHATKVFNTIEGGAIVCHDEKTKKRIDFLKNFGFADEVTVVAPGINAKMNELQAAYGILQLKYVNDAIERRRILSQIYTQRLDNIPGIRLLALRKNLQYNFAYFPILIDKVKFGSPRDDVYNRLKKNKIHPRRYFYPLISQFPTYRALPSASPSHLPVAEKIAKEILCLPLYPDLTTDQINRIVDIILSE
jgi:dTDP-4-amino-4,6-dideoxygalactose transaminase